MKLRLPKSDAIRIIQNRLKDLNAFDFDAKVWKDRTLIDIKQIFFTLDQWLQVYNIEFHTYIDSEKRKVLEQGKITAKKLLESYIDFINDHSAIQENQSRVVEERPGRGRARYRDPGAA